MILVTSDLFITPFFIYLYLLLFVNVSWDFRKDRSPFPTMMTKVFNNAIIILSAIKAKLLDFQIWSVER